MVSGQGHLVTETFTLRPQAPRTQPMLEFDFGPQMLELSVV